MIRDLAIVLPGPLESVIGMKKSSINLPTGTLPESYARMLCILKHSEKEYMKDSDALDSFLFMSMLHFILGEKVRGLRDLQFLTKAYRDVFHCRKVASLLQQR
jgi:predicted P-loop ATPase